MWTGLSPMVGIQQTLSARSLDCLTETLPPKIPAKHVTVEVDEAQADYFSGIFEKCKGVEGGHLDLDDEEGPEWDSDGDAQEHDLLHARRCGMTRERASLEQASGRITRTLDCRPASSGIPHVVSEAFNGVSDVVNRTGHPSTGEQSTLICRFPWCRFWRVQ